MDKKQFKGSNKNQIEWRILPLLQRAKFNLNLIDLTYEFTGYTILLRLSELNPAGSIIKGF